MEDMQKLIASMTNVNGLQFAIPSNHQVSVGCRFINGVTVFSPKREIEVFVPYGLENSVNFNDNEMQLLMKSQFVREFLRKNVLYFENDSDYETYGIYNRFDMSDDAVSALVRTDVNTMKSEFDKFTNQKRDDAVVHCLFYKIVELYAAGKLAGMSFENRKFIEEYFNYKIENAQVLMSMVKKVM